MNLISRAKFARLAGVTKQAVSNAIKADKIKLTGAGRLAKIDLDNADNIVYLETENRERHSPGEDVAEGETKTAGSDKPGAGEDINLADYLHENIAMSDLSLLSKQSAERLKIIAQIKQIQVKTEKDRGELISRELVSRFLGKMYTIDVNEFRPMGASLAPELAAIAGIDDSEKIIKIGERIEKEVFVILKHSKRLLKDFLTSLKVEKVKPAKKKKK